MQRGFLPVTGLNGKTQNATLLGPVRFETTKNARFEIDTAPATILPLSKCPFSS